jgi:hypothetical protein
VTATRFFSDPLKVESGLRLSKGADFSLAAKCLKQYPRGIPVEADDATGRYLHNWLEAQALRREA